MKFEDVLSALRAGKKVRRLQWDADRSLSLETDGAVYVSAMLNADDWIVVDNIPALVRVRTNEWGIFALPDILTPAGIREAGLEGKEIRITVEEVTE